MRLNSCEVQKAEVPHPLSPAAFIPDPRIKKASLWLFRIKLNTVLACTKSIETIFLLEVNHVRRYVPYLPSIYLLTFVAFA